uniref:AN1-type zinc finger protein 4 n=1 Tax=Cacopsylla melanoneura TaxID=428564 RepID=A0A8D9BKS3_9HEMI
MSHHGFKLNFAVDHELLTIFIETLTGSTFEMVVTPIDSIASIKAKIQRMEGILVSQQHLLYNMQELDDQSTVQDYGIQDGSTIKLVLSMRGGPLGTARRVLPLDDVVKEFVELERYVEYQLHLRDPSFVQYLINLTIHTYTIQAYELFREPS